jgi:predicted DNA-binding transcriptional regulator AlpA
MDVPDRILRGDEVRAICGGWSEQQLYRVMRNGDFPKSFPIVPNGRARGWRLSTVMEWLREREAAGNDSLKKRGAKAKAAAATA